MSKITDLEATRKMLRDLARVVKFTRKTLAAMIQNAERPARLRLRDRAGQLGDTLEHLEDMREGFILSQRTTPHLSLTELQALVEHILIDWDWLQSLNLSVAPADQIESLGPQLVVYNHALVAMAALPRLPAQAVTFPQRKPTYNDVSVPTLPGDMLARIEEIERMIYQAEVMPVKKLDYEPFRRTYAFFDASSWLVTNHLEPLLDS